MNKDVLSLYDGASCGQEALKRAKVKFDNYYSSEIDKHAIEVAKKNHPNTIQIGNVLEVDGKNFSDLFLLLGGSPCQSLSRSGDGTGFDGKSKLFWEYVRIKNESNPKYFLLENVVMKKEWENVISKELGVEPIMIDSTLVSAQKRQRLYWTNIPNISFPKNKNLTIKDIRDSENNIPVDTCGLLYFENGEFRVRNNTKKGYLNVNNYDCINLDFPTSKTRRGRVANQKANTLNTSCNQGIFIDGKVYRLSILECERLQTLTDNYTEGVSENQRRKIIGNGWTVDVLAHIFENLNNY